MGEKLAIRDAYRTTEDGPLPQLGKTALEILAIPAAEFASQQPQTPGPRPLRTTHTQQRTFDQQTKRQDMVPDINQE